MNSFVKLTKYRLDKLRRAVSGGQLDDEIGERLAVLAYVRIRESWSGYFPPASSPYNPPAIRTGTLDRAVEVARARKFWYVSVDLGSAPYAVYLEFGTSKMAPRPFFRRAIEYIRPEARTIAKDVWQDIYS